MNSLACKTLRTRSRMMVSAYDDEDITPDRISAQQRTENAERAIQRFFVSKAIHNLDYEAMVRILNPGPEFTELLQESVLLADEGFAPELLPPSASVAAAFREYGETDLGAVALARLLAWDDRFIALGWRESDGALSEAGIAAYGDGKWRPLRIASSGEKPDNVTPSGAMLLPDAFEQELYSTHDLSDPLAVIHHELKAHVLPIAEAKGMVPGLEMALICIRLESEMLREMGLPERRLHWGLDGGTLDCTLHEKNEQYLHGLVRCDEDGRLVEIDPATGVIVGLAKVTNS